MHRKILQNYIQSILPMSADKAAFFSAQFEPLSLNKKDFILQEDKKNKNTYVLESGLVRSYTFDPHGQEVTTNLYSAPCFVNDFLAFFKQEPSSENYQCVTSCQLWFMPFERVQECFHTYPEFREFGRMMLVQNYSVLHERVLGMIKDSAEKRYRNLLQNHPAIFQHVPLKIIASYLGITDSSLSRIRKDFASH